MNKQIKALNDLQTTNKALHTRAERELAVWQKTQNDLQIYTTLYDTAIGGRGKSMTFEVYIQRYYYSHVVHLANQRFGRMTGGLLELKLNETNLDLNVLDYHTGKVRPVRTLSGGEKFKAALSMALGMSDMVRSEVRDVDLGMLFIDEGFGTLDGNSIDAAIEILRQLSVDSGRLVAVISHRDEMQNGIEQKLIVRKHKEGDKQKGSYITF